MTSLLITEMLIIDGEVHKETEEVVLSRRGIVEVRVESIVIVTLDLSDNLLTEVRIENLPNLTTLSLSRNLLTEAKIENLPNLKILYLSDNRLVKKKIENLPRLEYLSLSRNLLTEAKFENLPSLNYLGLSGNQLTEVKIENLPNVKILSLSSNQLTEVKIENLPRVETLHLSNNPRLGYLDNLFSLRAIYLENTSIKFVDPKMVRYVRGNTGILPREHNLGIIDKVWHFLPFPIAEEIVPEIHV